MKKIDAVEMIRDIRDKQNKDTSGKSIREIIDYFREKARKISEKVKTEEISAHQTSYEEH